MEWFLVDTVGSGAHGQFSRSWITSSSLWLGSSIPWLVLTLEATLLGQCFVVGPPPSIDSYDECLHCSSASVYSFQKKTWRRPENKTNESYLQSYVCYMMLHIPECLVCPSQVPDPKMYMQLRIKA